MVLWLAPAAASAADAVRLQLKWLHQFQFAGYYAALEKGYYREAGIDVTIVEGGPQLSALDEVLAGRAEFGVGTSSVLVRRAQGAPLVVLAAVFQHAPTVLLVPRRDERVPSLSELQAARLLDAPDSDDIDAMLLAHGVDYRQLPRIPHGGKARWLADGLADAMVAYSTNEPFELDRMGARYVAYSPRDAGIDFYGDNLFTTQALLTKRPDLVRAFRAASLRGWRYALSHQAEVIELILRRYSQAKSREALTFEALQTAPLIQADLVDVGYQSPERWQAIAGTYQALGILKDAQVPPGLVFDPDRDAADRRLHTVAGLSAAAVLLALGVAGWILALNRRLQLQVQARQAAEERAAQQGRDFVAMADALPVAAYHSRNHPDGRTEVHFFAAPAERILGVPIAELRADPASRWRHIVPEDADIPRRMVQQAIARVRAGEPNVRLEIEARVEFDGRRRWVRSLAVPDRVYRDGWVSWNGCFEDITARKLAEAALQQEQQRLQATLDASPVGVAIVVDGVAVLSNPRMRELVLLTGQREPSAFVQPGLGDRLRALVARDGAARDVETQVWGPAGEVRDVLVTYLPTQYEGRPADLVWMVEVTRLKAVQKALEEAKAAAEEATLAKSSFLANMSHEIRTPMNAIIGMAYLVARSELPPKLRAYVHKISRAANSLLTLIDDILDLSKIEAGRMVLEVADFDLTEVLRHVATVTAGRAQDKGLEYLLDVAPEVPRALRGDAGRLGQVLVNLMGNAVKFTDRGEVRLSVRVLADDARGLRLQFSVRDTGIGIAPEQAGRLFEAFRQADESTTRRFGGSGLGLSICRRLVQLMQGQIDFASTPGAGTEFRFDALLGHALAAPAVPAPVVPGALNGLRVLVVDDNASACEVLQQALAGLPLQVHTADSGEAALAWLAEPGHHADLALVDWRMPGMDGLALARRLKRDFTPPPRVILVTAFGSDELRQEADTAGVDGFLAKPVDSSALIDALVALPGSGVGPAAPPVHPETLPDFSGGRVLLVDDNEVNRDLAVELLQLVGVHCVLAANGREALDRLAEVEPTHFHAVLMDLQMPVMGGYEATRLIRADARWARLPVLAMTAHALADERARCLQAGMNDHIAKPIQPQRFFDVLARWLPVAPAGAARRAPGDVPDDAPADQPADLPAQAGADAPATPPPWEVALRALPALAVDAALERVLGRRDSYEALLRRFVERQPGQLAEGAAALADGRLDDAVRAAHTLRGAAATIGADALAQQAAALEAALAAGLPAAEAAPRLAALDQALLALVAALQGALTAPAAAPAPEAGPGAGADPGPPDGAALQPVLDEIERLLARDDVRAIDLLQQHAAALTALLGGRFARVQREAGDYAMPEALQALREARAALAGAAGAG